MSGVVLPGAYVDADTPLHRLDARVKLVLLLASTVALFVTRSPWVLGAAVALALGAARVGGIPAKATLGALRPTAVLLAFSLLSNALVVDGAGDVPIAGAVGISTAGVVRGVMVVVRVATLVAMSLVMTSTTPSTAIADALAGLMWPLGLVGVPVGDVAMTISVALRFIPLTAEELLRIRDAQRARGVDFSSGSVPARVRRWLSVLAPLVVALFRRADELAVAMRERCYRGEGRTRLVRPLRPGDVAVLVAGLVACIAACLA